MIASTMQNKLKRLSYVLLPIVFWLGVWELASIFAGSSFLIPGIGTTLSALFGLLGESDFYIAVLSSLIRVILGLLAGITLGILTAILAYRFKAVHSVIAPAVSVIRSTPVASFIVILWIMMSGDSLAIFVSFLMVYPIIWQNMLDGFNSLDKDLCEVSKVFKFSLFKKVKLLYFPALIKFFIPAVITSVGLGWKSEIAAEIIAYTARSIGQMINSSKMDFDTPEIFALTLTVIVMSVILESVTKAILRRIKT